MQQQATHCGCDKFQSWMSCWIKDMITFIMHFALVCIWIPLNTHITQTVTVECFPARHHAVTSGELSQMQFAVAPISVCNLSSPSPLLWVTVMDKLVMSSPAVYFLHTCIFTLLWYVPLGSCSRGKHTSGLREQLSFYKHDGHGTAIHVFLLPDLVKQKTC